MASKKNKLGNPAVASMIIDKASKVHPMVYVGGAAILGLVVYKMFGGIFSGLSKTVDSAGNVISATLNTGADVITKGGDKVMQLLQLKDTPDEVFLKTIEENSGAMKLFDSSFMFGTKGYEANKNWAMSNAKKIHDYFSFFNFKNKKDNLYAYFNSAPTQVHIATISTAFYELYGKSLYTFLKSDLQDSAMVQIWKIILNKKRA